MTVQQLAREYVNTASLLNAQNLQEDDRTQLSQSLAGLEVRLKRTARLGDVNVAQFAMDVCNGRVRDEVANRGE